MHRCVTSGRFNDIKPSNFLPRIARNASDLQRRLLSPQGLKNCFPRSARNHFFNGVEYFSHWFIRELFCHFFNCCSQLSCRIDFHWKKTVGKRKAQTRKMIREVEMSVTGGGDCLREVLFQLSGVLSSSGGGMEMTEMCGAGENLFGTRKARRVHFAMRTRSNRCDCFHRFETMDDNLKTWKGLQRMLSRTGLGAKNMHFRQMVRFRIKN